MPKTTTNQGYSENTPLKQMHYAYFLSVLFPAARGIISRREWASPYFCLIDMNAGPGKTEEYGEGSPLIALRAAKEKGIKKLAALFIDSDDTAIAQLKENLLEFEQPGWELQTLNIDHSNLGDHIEQWLSNYSTGRQVFGLIYTDPNGYLDAPLDKIISLCKENKRLDVLVHLSGTGIKRTVKMKQREGVNLPDLKSFLDRLDKSKRFFREPYGKWQWSFAFMTNWADAPTLKKIDFYDEESRDGKRVKKQLTMTSAERKNEGQLNLFDE